MTYATISCLNTLRDHYRQYCTNSEGIYRKYCHVHGVTIDGVLDWLLDLLITFNIQLVITLKL
jgi:hypothetical protein